MNLKQLEAFVNVANTGSFSQTAKNLFLTQPTISAHISALETELNARLLIRNTKEVRLSEKGKILYEYAKKMLEIEHEINMEFGLVNQMGDGRIVIAASTIPAQYVLPQILSGFLSDNPGEEFDVRNGDSTDVIDKVINGEVQIGFTGTPADSMRCHTLPFYRDQLVVMTPVSDKFQNMKGKPFDISLFNEEPMIIREDGSGTRKESEKYLAAQGVDIGRMHIAATMDNTEAIRRSVAIGLGITVISKLAAEEYETSGKALVFQLPGGCLYRELNIVYSKKMHLRPEVRNFIKYAISFGTGEDKNKATS